VVQQASLVADFGDWLQQSSYINALCSRLLVSESTSFLSNLFFPYQLQQTMYLALAKYPTHSILLFCAETGAELGELKGHTSRITVLCFSPDSSKLASASLDGTVRLWDIIAGKEIMKLETSEGYEVVRSFTASGNQILTTTKSGLTRIWDLNSGSVVFSKECLAKSNRQVKSYLTMDNTRIISTAWFNDKQDEQTRVRVWHSETGQELMAFEEHRSVVMAVAVAPAGDIIASGSNDGMLILWNLETREGLLSIPAHASGIKSVRFSFDGTKIASNCQYDADTVELKIFLVATGEELLRLAPGIIGWHCFDGTGDQIICDVFREASVTATVFDATTGAVVRSFPDCECGAYSYSASILM
jgi:WD40 repeat protein